MNGNDLFIPGQETESKLPESCIKGFQRLLTTTNFNPVYVEVSKDISLFSLKFDFSY